MDFITFLFFAVNYGGWEKLSEAITEEYIHSLPLGPSACRELGFLGVYTENRGLTDVGVAGVGAGGL